MEYSQLVLLHQGGQDGLEVAAGGAVHGRETVEEETQEGIEEEVLDAGVVGGEETA